MRRWSTLVLVTPFCWALAMACSGGPSEQKPGGDIIVDPGPVGGGNGPVGGGDVIPVAAPQVDVQVSGKAVVQDGSYATGKLTAHASDPKNPATSFSWTLVGPGIAGGASGDGATFSVDLPVPSDKSNYVLTLIAKLGGKSVQKSFSFFTVPAPTAKILANVNQEAGLMIALADTGAVLKGQKIQLNADAKFAKQYKWQVSKDGAKAQDLGTAASVTFETQEMGKYQVALQAFGDGGFSPMALFGFTVAENAAVIDVKSTVTREASKFSDVLKDQGKYPIDSVLTIDASGIGNALSLMSCTVKDAANNDVKFGSKTNSKVVFTFDKAGKYSADCTYTLKADYIPKDNAPLSSKATFEVLPKAVALMTVNGQNCNPATPLLFEVGSTIALSAANSTGNVSSYSWLPSSGELKDGDKINASLKLSDVMGYQIGLSANGIGDSASVSCMVYAQPLPKAVISEESTVKAGRSYISGSHQRAKPKVTQGIVETFDWSLVNADGTMLKSQTTQKTSDVFEFLLSEAGDLTLKLTSKLMNLSGPSNNVPFASKLGQVSLITPLDFSTIQSIAAVSDTDVYFASPSAIFHKGVDGRVVQVKNISMHPALPNGLFARHAGDIYLLTTDGGFWRYTFKEGWKYQQMSLGANALGLSVTGTPTGNTIYVAASNGRLFEVNVETGDGQMITGGSPQRLDMLGGTVYSIAATGNQTSSGVVKCVSSSCTKVPWASDIIIAGDVTWKSIGASASAVYFSDGNSRILTIKDDKISKFGALAGDDYIEAFARSASVLYGIGNKGGVYRMRDTGAELVYNSVVSPAAAGGFGSVFWAVVNNVVVQVKDANPVVVSAQKSLGTPPAGCAAQKEIWTVGDVAYVSVCSVPLGKSTLYTIWEAPYQGDIAPNGFLADQIPVVGVVSDGAGGLLIMHSDGANINFVRQKKADGTIITLNVPLDPGEFFTGMSGKFFITSQGIRVNDGQAYPLVQPVSDAHHAAAAGDVLYYSYGNDTRLARFDLTPAKMDTIANVLPETPIVDVGVAGQRVFVLTAGTLYRYDTDVGLSKLYEAPASLMKAMALMNDHHMLLSLGLKGAVLVDLDGKGAPQIINVSAETPASIEVLDIGYNGTEFLLLGQDGNGALQLHQFGAPQ